MNTIGRIQFDFRMRNELFAQQLYGDWDRFFASSFEKVADEVLGHYDTAGDVIEIDCLNLDLGTIAEDEFYETFPLRLREALEESVENRLSQSVPKDPEVNPVRRISTERNAFERLCYFLLHGRLPWSVASKTDITALFLQVIEQSPAELKQFLRLYGHYTTLQQRLVYQLNDPELEKGIHLMRPSESTFISSYVAYLREKYAVWEQPELTETDYRHTVWLVVYAWMLTDRSSSFDKKSFLQQTISSLAARLNTSYSTLLRLLTQEIDHSLGKQSRRSELFSLLVVLRDEMTKRLRKEKLPDIPVLFDLLNHAFQKEIDRHLSDPSFTSDQLAEWLIPILSHTDSCRTFLSRLQEEQILRLVALVIPAESDFIIDYAHALDHQKEQGRLQGKAGSEFWRLKWMILFPILLENRGAAFNRRYFVRKVLQVVAARYNLAVIELLGYFMQQEVIRTLDNDLRIILDSLWAEAAPLLSSDQKQETTARLQDRLTAGKILTAEEVRQLRLLWQQPRQAIEWIHSLSEKECQVLITTLAHGEETFILQYATALDLHQSQGLLEGKTSGGFRYIKWYFILYVLMEKAGTSVNRRHFTASVFRHLAAHYNLAYFDLLRYFCVNDRMAQLPQALSTILGDLYREEELQLITRLILHSQENERYQLLEKLYPAEASFIRSFLQLMETIPLRQKAGLTGSYSRFIWENIFLILSRERGLLLNKRGWVDRIIQLLANRYRIPIQTIYKELSNSVRQGKTNSPDLKQIIMAENNHWENQDSANPRSNEPAESETAYHLHNAGIILAFPFLGRLFSMLKLMENNRFVNKEAQIRAIFILQYLIYGDKMPKEIPEYELVLNKLLTAYPFNEPLPAFLELKEEELKMADEMLRAILTYWEKLKNSSVAALRDAFLMRDGTLKVEEDRYVLTIQEKAYDMLIDTIPWNFRLIRFPWMEKRMDVKWR